MDSLLIGAVLLPLIAAIFVMLGVTRTPAVARWTTLGVSLIVWGAAALLITEHAGTAAESGDFVVSFERPWLIPDSLLDIRISVGLDGISLWLFGLAATLMVTAVLVSWTAIDHHESLFYGMLLMLLSGCLGVFAARDLLLFYVFFEFTLIPLFFLIGIWGSEDRRYAATKFFLFTLAGSLLTFVGLLTIVLWQFSQTDGHRMVFSIGELTAFHQANPMPDGMQWWVFLALFAGFAIKVPLFPLHTWLPLAHVQAPTAGSVFLAGVLLKIGTYGFLRFNIPLLPAATATMMPAMLILSVAGILYGALVALAQSDFKRLIAYSSVSHMGFCMLGLFALNTIATQGAVLQMVNHGLSTGALFALIGMLYERYHTREICRFGGLTKRMPIMAFFMLLFTFSSIGLPGLNGFAGEVFILLGTFQRAWAEGPAQLAGCMRVVSVLAVLGVVLGAWYMLWLVQRVFFGPLKEPQHDGTVKDLSLREICALAPLAVFVFWIGLYPKFFLDPMAPALDRSTHASQQCIASRFGNGDSLAALNPTAGLVQSRLVHGCANVSPATPGREVSHRVGARPEMEE